MPHVSAQCQRTPSDEALPVSRQHHEGDPRRGGGRQSPADAARRADPAPRRRALQLAAARAAGAAEGRAHRARGNEPRRGARAGDAGGAAGGAVAGVGPLERVRPGAAAPQGPARARLRARPDARGSDHRHRAARAAELPPAAGQLLPDPDQVPRRGAAALRRDARARVHHEGCLLLSSRCRLAAGRLPRHVRGLHAHLHAHRAHLPRGARRLRRHRRGRFAGISRARALRRGCDRVLRRRRLRRQSRGRRRVAARRGPAAAAASRCARWRRRARAPSRSSRGS